MGLLTIGAFARAARLSPKALRLYDSLGLLVPARVDPVTGYRLYAPEQLEQARLVAWLRRIGMPLALITRVCGLDAGAAAREIRVFRARAEAEAAARRDLAGFLIEHFERKDSAMTSATPPLEIRYAALSDTGLVRETNQDTAHAGSRLLAVADGFGSGGAAASAAAVEVFRRLDAGAIPAGALLNTLEDAIGSAAELVARTGTGSAPEETGTTLTAMLWTGSQLALVHIGDSRAHLLRGGELFRITHDHTAARSMVADGRITKAEAESHPQRSLLVRALARGADTTPDIRLRHAEPGDRYLLCSDGLSSVVAEGEIRRVLTAAEEPSDAVRELIALANGAGGPDNISCVVADVRERPPGA
ncbi:MerR family transcriptional regulator [Streptomyces sp. CAU 1734]|uniref:MerR family transcriptional regulator n=1 Tax=Streptomyces sp. CAU 1734 TaxID=3140360 RepID=UPI0032617236